MNLSRLYLGLTLLALGLQFAVLLRGMNAIGWDFARAFSDLSAFFASYFGQFVIVSLFASGTALTAFAIHEANFRRDYYLLWAIPVCLFFGIGVALPLYLYLRTPVRDE